MAILGEIIKENSFKIKVRPDRVVSDVTFNREFLQIRTYAKNDNNRERGSKQNLQFTKEKALEFSEIINQFLK
jgi:hypothetical protein|tara:strand:- start:637 stop:855 length:219 start_codon:yes stop_codon:yes gene_type:complete